MQTLDGHEVNGVNVLDVTCKTNTIPVNIPSKEEEKMEDLLIDFMATRLTGVRHDAEKRFDFGDSNHDCFHGDQLADVV